MLLIGRLLNQPRSRLTAQAIPSVWKASFPRVVRAVVKGIRPSSIRLEQLQKPLMSCCNQFFSCVPSSHSRLIADHDPQISRLAKALQCFCRPRDRSHQLRVLDRPCLLIDRAVPIQKHRWLPPDVLPGGGGRSGENGFRRSHHPLHIQPLHTSMIDRAVTVATWTARPRIMKNLMAGAERTCTVGIRWAEQSNTRNP